MYAGTGPARCRHTAPATMSANDSGPLMGIFGPRTYKGKLNLSGIQMKFFSASIAAILDFIRQSHIMKIIPGAQRQLPEGAGKRQPAQEPGILFYTYLFGGAQMDASTVIQAISNVGFPIAAFLLMWYQCNTVVKENTAAITEMRIALDDIKKG